ncbi:MAG: ABC transporter substrate-binding protein [Alphaproteobacteria bacterium]|nr:ABC transporter substrate-binding protein [Alphaproteobacteria bacterium]
MIHSSLRGLAGLVTAAAITFGASAAHADVTVGALMPLTGPLGEYGESSLNGVRLAAKEISQSGGILDGPLNIAVGDTQTNPQAGVLAAKQLIATNKVAGLIGPLASGVTIPVAQSVTSVSAIPQISSASTAPTITTLDDKDFLFRSTPHDALQGVVLGDVVRDAGYAKVAVVYVNNDYGKGLADAFSARFAKLGGAITASIAYEEKQASYRGELTQAAKGGPEALALIGYPGDGVPMLKQAIEEGLFSRFIFTDGMKSLDMTKAIPAKYLEGSVGTSPEAQDSEAKKRFEAAYEASYGKKPPLPFIDTAYDATYLLALAIEKAGSTDGAKVRDALRPIANPPGEPILPGEWAKAKQLIAEGKDIDYVGAAGSQNFDAAGDVPGTFGVWTVKGGEITTLKIVEP